jgi:hypothetical protein
MYTQARSQRVQLGAMHPLQVWMHPPGICKISKTDILISPLKKKKCDTLPHPRVASIELLWLVTNRLQKCVYMPDVLCDVIESINVIKVMNLVLTAALFTRTHT